MYSKSKTKAGEPSEFQKKIMASKPDARNSKTIAVAVAVVVTPPPPVTAVN